MRHSAVAIEALDRARGSHSMMNYATIIREFSQRGIPESEIDPRENVLTFHAWRALGRTVRKGEHGVHILTFIPMDVPIRDAKPGEPDKKTIRRPRTAVVFHVSQTASLDGAE